MNFSFTLRRRSGAKRAFDRRPKSRMCNANGPVPMESASACVGLQCRVRGCGGDAARMATRRVACVARELRMRATGWRFIYSCIGQH
eukprot:2633292-Pleurochrysis_carterae.AAC.2